MATSGWWSAPGACSTPRRCTALARECPLLRYGMTIEIRFIGQACHLARALGMRTMREPARA